MGSLLTKIRGYMNSTEAYGINVPCIVNAMRFMIEASAKELQLNRLGFVEQKYPERPCDVLHQRIFEDSEPSHNTRHSYVLHEYGYNKTPYMKSKFSWQLSPIMYMGTRDCSVQSRLGNLISYDYRSDEWGLKIESPTEPFTVTHKISPGKMYTNKIQDIHDEAELFQYSLVNNNIPDIVFESARDMMQLIQISPYVNAIDFRIEPIIKDMEYKDLEEEFNRKHKLP